METINNFLNRIFVNFIDDKVFVYQSFKKIGTPDIWTVRQAKDYLKYLEEEEIVV